MLSVIIANVCNASFTQGAKTQKHSIVRPILKKPTLDPNDLNSYRPISNLSFLSKTVERVVTARFDEHVETLNLLPSRQSAHGAHHSTETAVIDVHNSIVRNVDRGGHVSVLVLLDLSSAFDTVDDASLLEVLAKRFVDVARIGLDWFRSYFDGRTQTFYVGAQQSATFVVHCSVPQGSVLGVLKFISYTEDLPAVIAQHAFDHHLYANDTQLSDEPPITFVAASIENIEKCIEAVHVWCSSKRLQLNPSKFEIIWFGTRATLNHLQNTDLGLHVGADSIASSEVVRDLGVFLDGELTMQQNVGEVARVCYYHLRRFKKVRRILGPTITSRLVSAFVTSRLDYCNALLAGLPQSTIAQLQRVQNAAIRLLSNVTPRDEVSASLRELHWLQIRCRIIYKLCLMMNNTHVGRSPRYVTEMLRETAHLPNRNRLRSSASTRYELPAFVARSENARSRTLDLRPGTVCRVTLHRLWTLRHLELA